jgi:hypothetical protein
MIKHAFYLAYSHNAITQDDMDYTVLIHSDNEFLEWLYKKVSTINQDIANDLIGNSLIRRKKTIYNRIATYSQVWDDYAAEDSPYKVLTAYCDNIDEADLLKKEIVSTLNKHGQFNGGWSNIQNHQILLDIPPAHKDVQSGIHVNYADDALGKQYCRMQEVSAFLKTMGRNYLSTTKKIRFFVHPSKFDQIQNLTDYKTIIDNAITGWGEQKESVSH